MWEAGFDQVLRLVIIRNGWELVVTQMGDPICQKHNGIQEEPQDKANDRCSLFGGRCNCRFLYG